MAITDKNMPGMTSPEVRSRIAAVRPDLPVIICTGHSETLTRETALQEGFRGYLQKPVTSNDFLKSLGEALP